MQNNIYSAKILRCPVWRRVKNIPTVALRVIEGDKKEPGAWGYNWATRSLGDNGLRKEFLMPNQKAQETEKGLN
jgi:hypothetical protein